MSEIYGMLIRKYQLRAKGTEAPARIVVSKES